MALEPQVDALLDNATLTKGIDNGSMGQVLAQLKIITFLLREGLAVNVSDEDLTMFQLNNPLSPQ